MVPSITPLDCGSIRIDKDILTTGVDRGTLVDAPSIPFLVETDTDTVLVDTSYGDPDRMEELHYPCTRENHQTLEAALSREGAAPGDVDTVVLTHLHWDHCYNLELFEHADIYVNRDELEYAIAPIDFQAVPYESKAIGRRPPWLDTHLIPVEGETDICPSVTVFPTPGHAVGHQSVQVEFPDETVVIAGDAIPTYENLEGTDTAEFIPGYSVNTLDWWRSVERITARADRIIPGHEPRVVGRDGFDL